MKLVNRKEFLSLPNGIIYSTYESLGILDGLSVKTGSYENDWVYESLIDDIDTGDIEFVDYVLSMEDGNKTFKMDLECGSRDSYYEENQWFAVYEKDDVERLLSKLNDISNNYPIEKRR